MNLFSAELELADLLLSSGILNSSWDAILDTHKQFNDRTILPSVKYKVHHLPPNGAVIAFVSSPEFTANHFQTQGVGLISSEELRVSLNLFDFIGTKVNPAFSIDRVAVTVFLSLLDELTYLKNQLYANIFKEKLLQWLLLARSSQNAFFELLRSSMQLGNASSLIITGHCLGGSIASLFTLWILDNLPATSKRPLCITFGSPLVGDKGFQQAISERPTWYSSFMHVVSDKDLVPHLFIPQTLGVFGGSSSQTVDYRPFGTFLLCSEKGCSCFEEPESVLELLMTTKSKSFGNTHQPNSFQIVDYGLILENLMHRSVCRGVSLVDNSLTNLQAGITMQLTEIGVETQGNGGGMNLLVKNTVERSEKSLTRKRYALNPDKKLTERKIDLTYLEWYKKVAVDQGGYYDSYKNRSGTRDQIKSRQEIIKRHKTLTQYWKRKVDEVEKMPQQEGANFQVRYIYGGTNYRRMVEPLDIADYYKKGLTDYMNRGRSQHYVMLEKWMNDDKSGVGAKERKRSCSLTEDSCFWAHVEEAILSCKVLRNVGSSSSDVELCRGKLVAFESYVMDLVKNFAVSAEIFLAGSSFMRWWEEYCVITGHSYQSDLCFFMKNHYRNYV